jgi:hypothetical protein
MSDFYMEKYGTRTIFIYKNAVFLSSEKYSLNIKYNKCLFFSQELCQFSSRSEQVGLEISTIELFWVTKGLKKNNAMLCSIYSKKIVVSNIFRWSLYTKNADVTNDSLEAKVK